MSESSFVLCTVGNHSIALPADVVQAIHDTLVISPVADTVDWFLGLAVVKGRFLPITDLGSLLMGSSSTGHVLEIKPENGKVGLRVDDVIAVHKGESENMEIPQGDSDLPLDIGLSLYAVEHERKQYRVLEPTVLLQSRRFLNVNRGRERHA